jgi:hypothetical protein
MCIGSFFGGQVVDKMISKLVVIDMLSLIYFARMDLSQQCRNIAVKSWWSVLLVEEIGVPGEIHRFSASH